MTRTEPNRRTPLAGVLIVLFATVFACQTKTAAPAPEAGVSPAAAAAVAALAPGDEASFEAVLALGASAREALRAVLEAQPLDPARAALVVQVYERAEGRLPADDLRGLLAPPQPPEIRLAAIEAAAALRATELLGRLTELLEDRHDGVACAAARALGPFRHLPAARALLSLAGEERGARSEAAAVALGAAPGVLAERELAGLLDAPAPSARRRALVILAGWARPRSEALIAGHLDDPDESVRLAAMEALASLGTHTALAALRPMLASARDIEERRLAVALLAQFDPRETREAVWAALEDEDETIREHATRQLGRWDGNPAIVPALIARLGEPAAPVRRAAVEVARGLQRSQGLGHALIGQAQVETDPTVLSALVALFAEREMQPHAVPALVEAMGAADADRAARLGAGLEALTGQALGADAAAWREWVERQREPKERGGEP